MAETVIIIINSTCDNPMFIAVLLQITDPPHFRIPTEGEILSWV